MKLPIEKTHRRAYYRLCEEVFDSNFLSEGKMNERFAAAFGKSAGANAWPVTNCGLGLMALLSLAGVKGKEVIIPANTFMADAFAAHFAGGKPVLADCNRNDLCLSVEDVARKITSRTGAVIVTHIGGHLAFDINELAQLCRRKRIPLIEDCAHAHGAAWNGRTAGTFGWAGVYSFYSTKTMPLGEGGMFVSRDAKVIAAAKKFINYSKWDYTPPGMNCRMSELMAAFGLVQLKRLPAILKWKRALAKKYDRIFARRVEFPAGMVSGYYKYIVFDYALREETGKVFADPCQRYLQRAGKLPNSEWVAQHHACPPIWYGWEQAKLPQAKLRKVLLAEAGK